MLMKTAALVAQFGEVLRNGSYSTTDLDQLLAADTFTASHFYQRSYAYQATNEHHSKLDLMQDFVQEISKNLTKESLHHLTTQLLARAPDQSSEPTLDKVFWAYETAKFPEKAREHSPLSINISQLDPVIGHFTASFSLIAEENDESRYASLLRQLGDRCAGVETTALGIKIGQFITQIKALKAAEKEPLGELVSALENTENFLSRKMEYERYKSQAKTFQGRPSIGMQALGFIMVTLGLVLLATGRILVGSLSSVIGCGIFAKGRQTGLSKAMNNIAEAVEGDVEEDILAGGIDMSIDEFEELTGETPIDLIEEPSFEEIRTGVYT